MQRLSLQATGRVDSEKGLSVYVDLLNQPIKPTFFGPVTRAVHINLTDKPSALVMSVDVLSHDSYQFSPSE